MLRLDKKPLMLTGLLALLFVLAACGTPGMASVVSPTPLQLLQSSAQAMHNLKSVSFNLQEGMGLVANPDTLGLLNGLNVTVTAHGEVAAPDKASASISLGEDPLLAMIGVGPQVYVQEEGTWYTLNKDQVSSGMQSFFTQNPAQRVATILSSVKGTQITDHGLQSLEGALLDHITITLDQATWQILNGQLSGLLPNEQQPDQNQLKQASLDLWINPVTAYVSQVILHMTTPLDLDNLPQLNGLGVLGLLTSSPVTSVETTAQINFANFNQPLQIQIPANPLPLPENQQPIL
jgi:hypothetical protein